MQAFEIPALPTVAITGSDERFPVGRVFCVGRNYAAHAREMGGDPTREAPFFFTKFPQAIVESGATIPYPPVTSSFHHEGELVVAVGKEAAAIDAKAAEAIVFGYAAGLDMTRRDLQNAAKEKGRPWDNGKNFANAAPIGAIRAASAHGHITAGALRVTVDGVEKQTGDITDMVWTPFEVLSALSKIERLLPGDLVYTGTPAGVGPVLPGNVVTVEIAGLAPCSITIGEREAAYR
jgi:fumarylpyruvate hydrolase